MTYLIISQQFKNKQPKTFNRKGVNFLMSRVKIKHKTTAYNTKSQASHIKHKVLTLE